MMARKLIRRKRGVNGDTTQRIMDCANKKIESSKQKAKSSTEGLDVMDEDAEINSGRTLRAPIAPEREGAPTEVMEAVMKALKEMKDPINDRLRCELFLDLPPKKHFADYYLLIKDPISLNQISRKITETEAAKNRSRNTFSDKGYTTVTEFSNDLQKLFDNARSYNLPGSEVCL